MGERRREVCFCTSGYIRRRKELIWQRSCLLHQVRSSSSGLPRLVYPPLLLLLEDTITAGLCAWSGGTPPIHMDAGSWCCTFLSPQERMALERRIPTKLSALKDRLIAAFDKSLYLSSHSREIAWIPRSDTKWKVHIRKVWTFHGSFYKCNTNKAGTL